MTKLAKENLRNNQLWLDAEIEIPDFDYNEMAARTKSNPSWVHFGAGNIFRGFPAYLQQKLLNSGRVTTGIVAVETFDFEIIERIYRPYDNLSLLVIMNPDGTLSKKIIASIAESLIGDNSYPSDWLRLHEIFANPSLQMASFTITEKGYGLKKISGEYLEDVLQDMQNGPGQPRHIMAKVAALLYHRYQSGKLPIALVSMDNCSHNGEKLYQAVETIVKAWMDKQLVEKGFLGYISDPHQVSFPWSMIDKITPRPSEKVQADLKASGFDNTEIICTSKKTYIAPFVNAEGPQYLVIEDSFPYGRPPLEKAGVLFTDRQTVERVEKMKVCTCLNPLHTALAVFGCLLGYTSIAAEMKDGHLRKLVEKIGYQEGLPVVVNPGVINPEDFIREVIEERLPNPYIPDTPQRIASDTSQKVSIRFGETIKAYHERSDLNPTDLTYIPLAIAGWCRYLMALDDDGQVMPLSPDPMLDELKPYLNGVQLGKNDSIGDSLEPILSNERLFGSNLYEVGLGEKIENIFRELISGRGAVKVTLQKYLG